MTSYSWKNKKNPKDIMDAIKGTTIDKFRVLSYFAQTDEENITATTDYGYEITASVHKGNIYGCQFHPEKSGEVGLNILKAFCEM